ncbi:DUF3888 domain-containing protein [Rummeliibacillus pycnus]|uniref:DUF3888 domain-containing protein n=1 Tax=Rummeliibacillus pycnus TaxID=101070 RepID=UPI003D28FB83
MNKSISLILFLLVIFAMKNGTVYANTSDFPQPFEEILPEIGYVAVEEALEDAEQHLKKELKLPIRLPPITFSNHPTETKATRENLLEDVVIDLLRPQMEKVIEDYYGTASEIGTICEKIIDIKKLDHPGSWLFETKLEFTTYTGAHNPLDIFTVALKKDWDTNGWIIQDYKVKKFNPNKKDKCRSPV